MYNEYELIMIAPGDYTEEIANTIFAEYEKTIAEISKDKKVSSEFWGCRKLAYQIGKQTKGWYFLFTFWTTPEKFDKLMEEKIEHDASIIKHCAVLKTKAGEEDLSEFEGSDDEDEECEQDVKTQPSQVNAFDVLLGLASYEYAKQEGEKK